MPPGQVVTGILDDQHSIAELAVSGVWNRELRLRSYATMNKCLSSHPGGLLLNLSGLQDPEALSAPLWFLAEAQGERMTPPVPVVACVREDTELAARLTRLAAAYRLPRFPDIPQALAALCSRRPLTDQIRVDLAPEPTSAGTARQLVTAACQEWELTAVIPRARLIASELVANAIEHAHTDIQFAVTRFGPKRTDIVRRRNVLHLAVADHAPQLPPLRHGQPPQSRPVTDRGQGLHIVDAAADQWGAIPTRRGKLVWAILG